MLLREGVQPANDLGNRRHQLADHLGHILLTKLALLLLLLADPLLPIGRLHLREALLLLSEGVLLLGEGILLLLSKRVLLLLTLKMLRPMLLPLAAENRRLHLRLPLQYPDDLRHDRKDLTHHLLDVLRRQGPLLLLLLLTIAVTERRLRLQLLLSLGDNLWQKRHQLADDVTDVLLAQLTLLAPLLLRLAVSRLAQALRLLCRQSLLALLTLPDALYGLRRSLAPLLGILQLTLLVIHS
jgi:hypothetical protein